MNRIDPLAITRETYSAALNWIHLFLPTSLVLMGFSAVVESSLLAPLVGAAGENGALPSLGGIWKAWLLLMLVTMFIQLAQLSVYESILSRRPDWLGFALTRVLRRFLPMIGALLLVIFCMIVAVIPFALLGWLLPVPQQLGGLFVAIPVIVVAVLLYMTTPLILLDGFGPAAAIDKSVKITYGNAWRLVASMVLALLPALMLFALLLQLIAPESKGQFQQLSWDFSAWSSWARLLLTGLMAMLGTSFYLAAYKAIKLASDGGPATEQQDGIDA